MILNKSPRHSPTETDTEAISSLSSQLAATSVHDNNTYPSLSSPAHYSSTVPHIFSASQHHPADTSAVPYSPTYHHDNTQYGYYLSTYSPASIHSGPPTATPFGYASGMPSPHAVSGDTMVQGYNALGTFNTDTPSPANQTPLRGGRGHKGVYRPPHIQQALQHQQQQQQQQQVAAAYFAYGDLRPLWWGQQLGSGLYPTATTPTSGETKKVGQPTDGLQSSTLPYTPNSRASSTGSRSFNSSNSSSLGYMSSSPATTVQGTTTGSNSPMSMSSSGFPPRQYGGRGRPNGGMNSRFELSQTMNGYPHAPYTPNSNKWFTTRRDDDGSKRSPLLEDFRLTRAGGNWELSDVFGHIVEFSGDQHGSRFLQQKMESCSTADKQRIFDEVLPNAYQLMIDVFGNYVIQKMFELGDQRQKASLAKKMEGHVLSLSLQMYGCRVVQKALEHVLAEQRAVLVAEIEPHIIECVRSSNANHVIQRLVSVDPPASLPRAFTGHLEELATNAYGCRVIQKMFELLSEDMKRELLDEMHPIASKLMQDQFGNYVVQSVISMGAPADRDKVIGEIKGQMLSLSRHKFASNVCEKALLHASVPDRRLLVEELMDVQPDGSTKIPLLLRDAFGNFPLQTALQCAEEDQRVQLLDLIIPVLPLIRQTPVGKRLEARLHQWELDGSITSATHAGANMRAYNDKIGLPAVGGAGTGRLRSVSTGTTDSGYSDQSGAAALSTGVTSPTTVYNDQILRSSAPTLIRDVDQTDLKGKGKDTGVGVLEDLLRGNDI